MALLSILRLVLHALWIAPLHTTLTAAQENSSESSTCPPKDAFDWDSISPSKSADWTPCYDTNFCARLKVPFDYTNPQGDELAIALLKIPANISTSDPAYRGPILINPGGPGGSGVDLALLLGSLIQTLVGADFDIIGFDPRGVGKTTPGIDAFRGAELQRQVWGIRSLDIPTVDDSVEALPRAVAIQSLNNRLLADKAADIAPYVGTAAVAHDMLSIVEALGQERLQYWGVSYGSVLGTTFASLFPDKVGRLIVDGVVNGNEWYRGNNTGAVRDTDSIISIVAGECATSTDCPLHEATTGAVEKRLFNIFESLRTKIVTLYDAVETMAYIDRKLALASLWTAVYFPYTMMAPLFEALADLEEGDGLKFYHFVGNYTGNFTVTCQQCHPLTVGDAGASPDADTSIQCADSGPVSSDLSFLKGIYDAVSVQTYLADIPFYYAIRCVGWALKSKSRFEGTLGGDTSSPLLFIGNTHDPITPLANAFTMSSLFEGSAVLTRDAIGHTSLSGVSPCTYQAVRDYFRDGALPSPGTVCDDITDPLFGNQSASTRKRALAEGGFEEQILEAATMLSKTRFSYRFGVSV